MGRIMRRAAAWILVLALLPSGTARADYIHWVEFEPSCEALACALEIDVRTLGTERHLPWVDLLAMAATQHGSGRFRPAAVQEAARLLAGDASPKELLGERYRYYQYWREAYGAVLGGLVGTYAVQKDGQWRVQYGLKAFSPIAEGYDYAHYADFGARRSFGYARPHLGNDLMGTLGTPICAIEGGVVEALGWNRYGGWRVGVRSLDGRRYWYYAHLRKGAPYRPGLQEGDIVQAGDVLGYMGRTGYSDTEDTNNIETVHLHLGLQLIFDESQKEGNNEIWVDVYQLVRLLARHRCSIAGDRLTRVYPYRDLDAEEE